MSTRSSTAASAFAKRSAVTSMNGLARCFSSGRQRQEQHLARGLVDGVAQRRVEHARQLRRPERARCSTTIADEPMADRQQQHRERPDPSIDGSGSSARPAR